MTVSLYTSQATGPGTSVFSTPYSTIVLPPGSTVVAYVRSGGAQTYDTPEIKNKLVTTLSAALRRCRSNARDVIIVLPGHSESITSATYMANLVASTQIVGIGWPEFRWTDSAGEWDIAVAGVSLYGLRLRTEGANGITKAIDVRAADCAIIGCDIECSSGASNDAAIVLEIGTAAHRFRLQHNTFRGTTAVTDVVHVAGVANDVRILDNRLMVGTGSVSTGLIRVSAAALRLGIERNVIINTLAASESGISVGAVAATGWIANNYVGVLAGTITGDPIEINAAASFYCFENRAADTVNLTGIVSPTADVD